MNDPTDQLRKELLDSIRRALRVRRPILTHINADTTWLIQLPYPRNAVTPLGRLHYNVLIDPWLQGSQSDVASWFSKQWHAIDSSVQTIAELNERLQEVEELAGASQSGPIERVLSGAAKLPRNFIDAVVLSHEFTDHTHEQTLKQIESTTPVFATQKAAELVRSWGYFDSVSVTPNFSGQNSNWKDSAVETLPSWLNISRIVTKNDSLYYHSAILIGFDLDGKGKLEVSEGDASAEAIIYTPHGIRPDDLSPMPNAVPPIRTLALLHGLHDVGISFTKQLNLGATSGLRAQRICGAKYWVSTHDEIKRSAGFIAPFLRRKVWTVKEALEMEKEEKGYIPESSSLAGLEGVRFAELQSGESLLLE
ncbi:MAG: hypothetical protein MMC33_000007 [Icmadophila ericetorum]|nr:hypothetical protein [Icmadophila ericetorum]